ncbi:unnamed protein product [Orchesella dallaii]|uniref:Uncharacterized protein n=1 Tax=Orchesella dallaii TaxID=48710 RepID=A0ABP1S7E5_9HEXA
MVMVSLSNHFLNWLQQKFWGNIKTATLFVVILIVLSEVLVESANVPIPAPVSAAPVATATGPISNADIGNIGGTHDTTNNYFMAPPAAAAPAPAAQPASSEHAHSHEHEEEKEDD